MVTDRLAELVSAAVARAAADGAIDAREYGRATFERPRRSEHGDWATNVALAVAAGTGNPRAVAHAIAERMPESDLVARVDVAGPGFLNFHLAPAWFHGVVRRAATPHSGFGRSETGAGVKVNVEYVSANPTGPVNVVSGRHGAVGDAIANLLMATGHEVAREFYVNDSGRQVLLFGESIAAHYLQHFGREAEVPEGGYLGDYVAEVARDIAAEHGDAFVAMEPGERSARLRDLGVDRMLDVMRASLARFGTHFDLWFRESSLHDSGEVEAVFAKLGDASHTEERDGALWFRSSALGDDKDRVLRRSNGDPTYLAADAAYLMDKFERGFDRLIYLWGADHHGTVARLKAAAQALGHDPSRVTVPLVQIVTLVRGDQVVMSSKRAGDIVELDELVDEVGVDAARYIFLARSIDAPLEFDIELASQQAPENPVYYVQYAHARISSILRKAPTEAAEVPVADAPLEVLRHPAEEELMRKLDSYEGVVADAATALAPQRMCRYAEELAAVFSRFYRDCRVVSDVRDVTAARLALCRATKAVLADALGLLGVSAPETM